MVTKKQSPFRTMTDPKKTINSDPGSRIEQVLALRILDNGEEDFYIQRETNIYLQIQAHKDECDLEKLLITCTQTGDLSLINKKQPIYMDLEEIPENFFEAYQKIKEEEKKFNNLPAEIKEKFNNNFSEYLATAGTEDWLKKTGLLKNPEPDPEPDQEPNTKPETKKGNETE